MLEGFYFQAPEQMSRAWPAIVWSFGARRKRATVLAGGIASLPEALAQTVKVCLALATPAEAIDIAGLGVSVQTSSGTFQADYLVLATTASVARQLYAPEHDVENRLLRTGYSAAMNIGFAVPEGVSAARVPRDLYGLLIPRRERQVITAIGVESRKCQFYVPQGELLNVMLSGSAASRLMEAPEGQVLAEVKRIRYRLVRSLIHLRPEEIGCGPNTHGLRMEFDRALGVGARGGHGPIKYVVEEYTPGKSIKFRFTGPKGFDGFHGYEIVSGPEQTVALRHTLKMSTHGPAILSWPLVYRPMHDALIEDSLATAQVSLGVTPQIRTWSLWVKILRCVVSGGKARSQTAPNNALNTDAQEQRAD